jgi:hypothetical protein
MVARMTVVNKSVRQARDPVTPIAYTEELRHCSHASDSPRPMPLSLSSARNRVGWPHPLGLTAVDGSISVRGAPARGTARSANRP